MGEVSMERLQLAVLVGLIGAAGTGLVRAFTAETPIPSPDLLSAPNPAEIGYRLRRLPDIPPANARDQSHGVLRRWQGTGPNGAGHLEIAIVLVESRDNQGLSIANLTRGAGAPPGLALRDARTVSLNLGLNGQGISGRLAAKSEGMDQAALQTCLVTGGNGVSAGATHQELAKAVAGAQHGDGPADVLARWLGLRRSLRWQCQLVSVASQGLSPEQRSTALQRLVTGVVDWSADSQRILRQNGSLPTIVRKEDKK